MFVVKRVVMDYGDVLRVSRPIKKKHYTFVHRLTLCVCVL